MSKKHRVATSSWWTWGLTVFFVASAFGAVSLAEHHQPMLGYITEDIGLPQKYSFNDVSSFPWRAQALHYFAMLWFLTGVSGMVASYMLLMAEAYATTQLGAGIERRVRDKRG